MAYLFKKSHCVFPRLHSFYFPTKAETISPPPFTICWLSLQLSRLYLSEAPGWPPGLLIFRLIMRAHTGNILSASVWKPWRHHAIAHFYADLFCSPSCKLYRQEDEGSHLRSWGTVWGLIDWLTPWSHACRRPQTHKHTVTSLLHKHNKWMDALAGDWTRVMAYISLPLFLHTLGFS